MIRIALAVIGMVAWCDLLRAEAHTDVYVVEQNGVITINGFGCPDLLCGGGQDIEASVFTNTLNEFYGLQNPGFRARGGDLPVSTDFSWDFMPMTVDTGTSIGLTSTLLYWDGLGQEVDFGMPSTTDYDLIYQGKDNLFGGTGTGDQIASGEVVFTSTAATSTSIGGSTHTHGFFLLDSTGDPFDGVNDPDAGIYLAAMRLRADSLVESDPFFLLFRTQEPSLAAPFSLADAWVNERVDTLASTAADPFPGDFNLDGRVDNDDLNLLLGNWGQSTVPPAWTGAQTLPIDNDELNTLLSGWGAGVGTAVPEPGALGLAATGLALGVCRFHR